MEMRLAMATEASLGGGRRRSAGRPRRAMIAEEKRALDKKS
jgi:hypothetical protein